jgi:hypothetical protein
MTPPSKPSQIIMYLPTAHVLAMVDPLQKPGLASFSARMTQETFPDAWMANKPIIQQN